MPRKQHTYHYIYKITCNVTGKYYIGMHSTSNLDDEYFGSGKIIRQSINKHGKCNHTKEILEWLDNRVSLKNRELTLVNKDILKDPLCMNLVIGGEGGWEGRLTKNQLSELGKRMNTKTWITPSFVEAHKKRTTELFRKLHSIGKLQQCNWTGKTHKEESKIKIGKANSEKQKGPLNSQFGTIWITHDTLGKKKIKNDEFLNYELNGWHKGRK